VVAIEAVGTSSQGYLEHQGEEMGYGALIDGGPAEGDCKERRFLFLSFAPPHGYRNIGSIDARVLWVNTPQSF
jgi:hypothetical protein